MIRKSWPVLLAAALAAGLVWTWLRVGPPAFHGEVALVLHARCAGCHHDGGAAPFPLVTFDEARKRGTLILDVISRRVMPPWMPDPGCADFEGDRSLSAQELDLVQRWLAGGMPEGDPRRAGPLPVWADAWAQGTPDYVVTLPEAYTLAADGRDVYRNFVLPVPLPARRFVRGLEFRPGNAKAVHHAFLFVDRTRESERLDQEDPQPGFPGLHVPPSAQAPPGHFLSWQPGRRSTPEPEDMAWTLHPGSSIVLQMHLRPTGKPERIQPSVGLYFTDRTPTRTPTKIGLWTEDIRIPAGGKARVRDTLTLPADVDLLRILPHAHFLARTVEATAVLPDGTRRCLLRIPSWDFNWQGDYAYRAPVALPKGTTLTMEITYDNGADNPRNPNQPPKEVRYGVQSGDEMAEIWMQVLPKEKDGAERLEQALAPKVFKSGVAYNRYLLGLDPNNARARTELGKALFFLGSPDEAASELTQALRIRDEAEPHYFLGLIHRVGNRPDAAAAEFRAAIRAQPGHAKAYGNLGLVLLEQGKPDLAEPAFEEALRLNPEDELARSALAELRAARKKR